MISNLVVVFSEIWRNYFLSNLHYLDYFSTFHNIWVGRSSIFLSSTLYVYSRWYPLGCPDIKLNIDYVSFSSGDRLFL